jgi:hypothetical protein
VQLVGGLAELRVPLRGYVPDPLVVRHDLPPSEMCTDNGH